MRGLPQKQNARRAYKIRLCGHLRRYKNIVKKTYIIYIEFLNEIRLEEVLKDLKNTDDKVAIVAENHGFHNQEYFSRYFKKVMGISPAKWRQQNR